MKHIILAAFVAMITTIPATAENKVKVPFLFTEDQGLPQTDLEAVIEASDVLKKNKWLNAPMTRLEYLLSQIEANLNSDDTTSLLLRKLVNYFERVPARFRYSEPVIKGTARYYENVGKVSAIIDARYFGKPKHPLRKTCDEILNFLAQKVPQEVAGNLYQNAYLKILVRADYREYDPIIDILVRNIVHAGTITTMTDGGTEGGVVYHTLTCMKADKDAATVYSKYSYRIK